jgi:hypothetical protein
MYKSHAVQLDKCDATGLNGSNFAKAQKHKSPAGAHLQGLFLIHEKILLWRKGSNLHEAVSQKTISKVVNPGRFRINPETALSSVYPVDPHPRDERACLPKISSPHSM